MLLCAGQRAPLSTLYWIVLRSLTTTKFLADVPLVSVSGERAHPLFGRCFSPLFSPFFPPTVYTAHTLHAARQTQTVRDGCTMAGAVSRGRVLSGLRAQCSKIVLLQGIEVSSIPPAHPIREWKAGNTLDTFFLFCFNVSYSDLVEFLNCFFLSSNVMGCFFLLLLILFHFPIFIFLDSKVHSLFIFSPCLQWILIRQEIDQVVYSVCFSSTQKDLNHLFSTWHVFCRCFFKCFLG